MTPTEVAVQLLKDAADLIGGPRHDDHGDMVMLHLTIAELWTSYLSASSGEDVVVSPCDVSSMMELLKIARRVHGGHKRDHYLDSAGYAAIAYAVADEFCMEEK